MVKMCFNELMNFCRAAGMMFHSDKVVVEPNTLFPHLQRVPTRILQDLQLQARALARLVDSVIESREGFATQADHLRQ